ncbi:unnamed protein product, partial [Mesorhabditis spiculigera]
MVTNCKASKKNIAVVAAWFKWTMRGFVYIVLMGYLQLEDRLKKDVAEHGLDLMRQRDASVNPSNLLLMIEGETLKNNTFDIDIDIGPAAVFRSLGRGNL